MLRRILRNTLAGYLLKFLQMLIGLIAIPVFASELGADRYGLILLAGTLLGYFAFFDLGLSDAITKFVAQYDVIKQRDEIDRVIGTSLAVFLGIGFCLCALVLGAIGFGATSWFSVTEATAAEAELIFTLAAILSLLAWPRLALQGALRGLQEFVPLNVVLGLGRLFAVALAMICAIEGQPLWVVFLAYQADVFVSALALPYVLRQKLAGWWPKFDHVRWSVLTMTMSFSLWLMMSKLAVLLEYNLDTVILGIFLPLSAITAYTILTYPFRMIQQFSGLAAAAIMPAVSALQSQGSNQAQLRDFCINGARLHNAFLAIVTMTVVLTLQPFIELWVGAPYTELIWIAYVACGFQFIWQSNAFFGQIYTGMGLARKPGIVAIITGFANLFLSLILIQLYGLPGVILGTVFAGLFGVAIVIFWCLPDLQLSPRIYVKNILLRGQAPIWCAGPLLYGFCKVAFPSIENWAVFLFNLCFVFITLCGVAYGLVMNRSDRAALRGFILYRKAAE